MKAWKLSIIAAFGYFVVMTGVLSVDEGKEKIAEKAIQKSSLENQGSVAEPKSVVTVTRTSHTESKSQGNPTPVRKKAHQTKGGKSAVHNNTLSVSLKQKTDLQTASIAEFPQGTGAASGSDD